MANFAIIKLCRISPIHIGTGRESYDSSSSWLHSDTIASALAALRAQCGATDIQNFLDDLVISSAFPFYGDMLFLPKAHGRIRINNEVECRKKLKHASFVELSLWQQLAQGEILSLDNIEVDGAFMYPSGYNCGRISCAQTSQRVKVYADSEKDADPFFFEWNYFDKNAGLFFMTTAEGKQLESIVSLMKQLGETGLGTDKNVGGGNFDVEVSNIMVDDIQDANAKILLSMYIPSENELLHLNLDQSFYSIQRRGGFAAGSTVPKFRHLRKKNVYMFDEGSVFMTTSELKGDVVDLRPDWNNLDMHPMYRSGKPFSLPYKIPAL